MRRLSEITFRLPAVSESRAFLAELRSLLAQVPYAEFAEYAGKPGRPVDRLSLTPPQPAGARPSTVLRLADVPAPEIAFDIGRIVGVLDRDSPDTPTQPAGVGMADLTHRLVGHVQRVDHTGVNLPACATSGEQWQELVSAVASASTMYRYPTGEPWRFVLPSTDEEFLDDIRDFVVGREPRFELVHDQWSTQTQWQFALRTDLTRIELERLFPEPEGTTLPGLEEFFRVVPVLHAWPGLGIRLDLYYRADLGSSDWTTGECLVTKGGRIR